MENEKKLRLIQVAKEFKVGLNTITDYLHKKGVTIDGSPNTQIAPDVYALIEKEFGANRSTTSARDSVREKIAARQGTVSIEEPKPAAPAPKKNTIDVKDEISQPKILGKIDLSGGKSNRPAESAPQPKPQPQQPKPQPSAEKPKPQSQQPKPQPQQPKPQPQPQPNVQKPAQPAAQQQEVRNVAEFKPTEAPTLVGPQILGKMDVTGMVPGGKHRRKRLDKEKVDVTKQNHGGGGNGKGGNQKPNQQQQQNKKAEEKRAELLEFIARFSANAAKSKQATSRKKLLDNINVAEIPVSSRRFPFVAFKPDREIGNELLTVTNLSKTIDGKKVLDNVSFTILPREKVALIGSDTVAKTTLLQILAEEIEPDEGFISVF